MPALALLQIMKGVIGASGAPRASAFGSNVGDVLLPYPWATATVALPTANPRTAAEILLNAINSCFTDFSSNLPVLMDLYRSIGRSLDSNLNCSQEFGFGFLIRYSNFAAANMI